MLHKSKIRQHLELLRLPSVRGHPTANGRSRHVNQEVNDVTEVMGKNINRSIKKLGLSFWNSFIHQSSHLPQTSNIIMAATGPFRLSIVLLLVLIVSLISSSEANWFGKRGEKVDDTLLQILEGNMAGLADSRQQLDAEDALKVIGKVIQDYFRQTAQGKPGAK